VTRHSSGFRTRKLTGGLRDGKPLKAAKLKPSRQTSAGLREGKPLNAAKRTPRRQTSAALRLGAGRGGNERRRFLAKAPARRT